jgi:hypothetical protein
MKKLMFGSFALLLVILVISACNKFGDLGGNGSNSKLVASSYKVKRYQPDSLLLNGAKATDSVHWSVTPSGYDSLITKNNAAVVFFKKAGVYQVKATDAGVPATVSITVSDSVYHPLITYWYTQLTGDQITLVPHYVTGHDSSFLQFVAQTKNYYCGTSRLMEADSLIGGKYGIRFLDAMQPNPCVIGESPIAAVISFANNQPAPLPNGTFPLSVTLNNTTYTGSIVVTSATITFNWNYTAGVLISPMHINR